MSLPVAILISGGGSNMEALVRAMLDDPGYPAHPVLVLSNNPQAGGLMRARRLGIKTQVVDHRVYGKDRTAFENTVQAHLEQAGAQLVCLAGFMRILSPAFIKKWPGRILNIHPSLLPKYKGLNTHARAIEAGESHAGCSVHLVTAELDGGPVLAQASVPVRKDDTAQSLAARVLEQEHIIYPRALRSFAARLA